MPFCEALAVRMIRRRPLSGTGLIEALLSDLRRRQSDSPERGAHAQLIFRARGCWGDPSSSPSAETVAVESFSLLALRRTAKLSLTTRRPESGGRSPRLAIRQALEGLTRKPAPRSDSPLVDYPSRFAQGETGASVGRRPFVGLGDFKGHVFGRNMVEHTPGRRAGGDRRSCTGKSPGRFRPRPAGNQGDMAAPADGVCPG